MDDELRLAGAAGRALHTARKRLADATQNAKAATIDAAAAGTSEVVIARLIGVSRATVREWLGKPRQR